MRDDRAIWPPSGRSPQVQDIQQTGDYKRMLLNFDYDGVIGNSLEPLVRLAQAAQAHTGQGRSPVAEDFAHLQDLTFRALGGYLGIPERGIDSFLGYIFQHQPQMPPAPLFPAMGEVLATLARRHTLVIVTASQGDAVQRAIDHHGLSPHITQILGGDLGLTKADRILQAQIQGGFSSQETYMVGDAVSDIRQGKLAGVYTVAVAWGFQPLERLRAESPHFCCHSPQDLLTLPGW